MRTHSWSRAQPAADFQSLVQLRPARQFLDVRLHRLDGGGQVLDVVLDDPLRPPHDESLGDNGDNQPTDKRVNSGHVRSPVVFSIAGTDSQASPEANRHVSPFG